MKSLGLDRASKYLYGATIGILLVGLCFAALGPLMNRGTTSIEATAPRTESDADPILAFVEERAAVRGKEQDELKAIMQDEGADASLKLSAGQRLMKLMDWTEQETTIEGVLRIRGYRDPVVSVHQDSCNVMVRAESLTREQSAQMLELVSRETGLLGGNIKIIPIN